MEPTEIGFNVAKLNSLHRTNRFSVGTNKFSLGKKNCTEPTGSLLEKNTLTFKILSKEKKSKKF
jgi:hypothetical protein